MNYAIVFRLLGYVLMIEGALLLLPAAASLVYGEWMVLGVFLLTAAVSAGIGYALHTIKPRSKVFYMREGFAATSLCWVFISVMGAVTFVLTGCTRTLWMLCLRQSPALPPPVPVSCPPWRGCPTVFCSGAASPTGSAAWVFWCFCSRCCR